MPCSREMFVKEMMMIEERSFSESFFGERNGACVVVASRVFAICMFGWMVNE